jgi:phosphate transport system permease protein
VKAGFSSLNLNIFTKDATPPGVPGGGLRNAIVGSLMLVGMASLIGLPLGILGGIYQIESRGKFANIVRFFTGVLNSIPSIIIGLFVYVVVVIPTAQLHPGQAYSAFAGSIALGIIMVPTIMRTTEEILSLVPTSLTEASLALGATRLKTMWSVVLPAARGGIITGVMLAMSRIAGESAPLLFTSFGNNLLNLDPSKATAALPLGIYYGAISSYPYLQSQAEAGAIILILIIFTLSLLTRFALRNKALQGK